MAYEDLFNQYLANRSPQFGGPTMDTEANVQPKSTTITYNPDGTQTVTEKKEITPTQQYPQAPQPVAPVPPQPQIQPQVQAQPQIQPQPQAVEQIPQAPRPQPVPQAQAQPQPAPTAPVAPQPVPSAAPDQTYQRMIQAESGGQNYTPSGAPLTSPKGAMFAAQVMPSTAASPGYGVRPAQAQTPEEYNRVGQEYYQAMLKQFGGDPRAAAAAYNAGPGRVQQNMAQNQGQLNVAQLPQETQQYLQRVQPGQPQPMIAGQASSDVGLTPTEQAIRQTRMQPAVGTNAPAPTVPPAPSAGPVAQNQYTQMTGQAPTEANWHEYYGKQVINNLSDPVKLAQIYKDPNAPEFAKIAAARQTAEIMSMDRDQQAAMRKVDADLQAGNTVAIADALKKRSEEGSYVKAYLFQRLGLTELAQEEQGKLGAGRVWEQNTLDTGETALIQRDRQGLPLFGISQSGRELTPEQLVKFGGAPVKGAAQHAQVYKDPFGQVQGNYALETRPGRAPVFREIGTGRLATPEEAKRLNAVGVAGPLEQIYASKYLAGGATRQGQAAAEGFQVGPLPGAPGYQGQPGGLPAAPGVTPPGAPMAPTVQAAPNIPSASMTPPAGVAQQKQNLEIAGKRTEAFNKIIDTEYRDNAGKGEIVSSNRKQQFDILNRDDPTTGKKVAEQISGLYNAANESPGNQGLTMIRDIFGGKFAPEAEVSQRIAQLNLSPAMKSALIEYNALNAQIAGQTLRETAGPGSVSDAEQAANRARNVDITKTPMLGAYNMMGQSQFNGDLQRYKADLAASPNNMATNATQFDSQFRRHSSELTKAYREVAEARLKYIQDHGSTPTAIREGYKRYPVPEYDTQTGNWKYLKPLDQIFKKEVI